MQKMTCLIAIAVLASSVSVVWGQAGYPAAIQQRLYAQYRLTTITADRSDIVTAGDVVVIHKPGLIMYAVASPVPPSNSYKNGKIGQGWGGFGSDLLITIAAPGGATANDYPHRPFVPEEKCWVTGIKVQKDGVLFQLYSDPYGDIRYYANLKIPFPNKKEVPSVDVALQTVAEVLTAVAPETQNQGDAQLAQPQGNASQPIPASNDGAAGNSATFAAGKYIRKDKNSDFLELDRSGTFVLIQEGKPYTGTFSVEGQTLILKGRGIRGEPRCSLVGNTVTDPGGTIWEKPLQPAPAIAQASAAATSPAPASMPDIAPPPPPADAPPPTISLGQTMDQVTAGFGQPMKVANLGGKAIFYYKDMKVTFTNGKVSNVE